MRGKTSRITHHGTSAELHTRERFIGRHLVWSRRCAFELSWAGDETLPILHAEREVTGKSWRRWRVARPAVGMSDVRRARIRRRIRRQVGVGGRRRIRIGRHRVGVDVRRAVARGHAVVGVASATAGENVGEDEGEKDKRGENQNSRCLHGSLLRRSPFGAG